MSVAFLGESIGESIDISEEEHIHKRENIEFDIPA
jgi:hypothetical protein